MKTEILTANFQVLEKVLTRYKGAHTANYQMKLTEFDGTIDKFYTAREKKMIMKRREYTLMKRSGERIAGRMERKKERDIKSQELKQKKSSMETRGSGNGGLQQ